MTSSLPSQVVPHFVRLSTQHVAALANLDEETNPHPWTGKQWLDSLQQHDCFGLWLEQQLIGFAVAMTTLDEAEILLIAINPAQQGRGLGSALLRQTEAALANEGVKNLFLEVRHSNQRARDFYLRHGWLESGRRKNYYPCQIELADGQFQTREDAILCSKLLCLSGGEAQQ